MANKKRKNLEDKIKENGGLNKFNYMFFIPINQKVILENGWYDLDIIDVAIFHAIHRFISVGKPQEMTDSNNKRWYWVSESKILNELPLIPLNSVDAVRRRVEKLIKYGLIERKEDNVKTRMKLITLGVNAGNMFSNENIQ